MTKKSIDVAIIGVGNWGNHLLEELLKLKCFNVRYISRLKKEDVKAKTDAQVVFDNSIILKDPEIKGVIIATQPETHFEIASKFLEKGMKVFIEKPLTLRYAECESLKDILNKNKKAGIMVGNKFVYSTAIRNLKKFISDNDIQVRSISSRWLKGGGVQPAGIFFDIAYHHIYLCNYLLDLQFNDLKTFQLNKDEDIILGGIVILNYDEVNCSIEVTYNNHFDFYDHSFRIETDKGVFIIKEMKRRLSVFFDNRKMSDLSFKFEEEKETCVEEELTAYYNWICGENLEFGPEHDFEIIKYLEKSIGNND